MSHSPMYRSSDYSEYKPKKVHLYQQAPSNQYGSNDSVNVVHEILCDQDLSRAGNLFNLSYDILLKDFPTTLRILKNIIDNRKYINNLNEQSIVEIVLTKCMAALRETKMIVNYYDDLLEVLEICLKYNLNNRYSYNNRSSVVVECDTDKLNVMNNTPHANIVSDILSSILLDYLDPDLSQKAVPVCVKLLQHNNIKRELLREICSYLNLVACRSPDLLVDYVYYIVNAIFKGNSCLSRLLFQLSETNIECIYPLTKHLVKTLKNIESPEDLITVLKIMYMISLSHVQLIVVHLDNLIGYLVDETYQDYVLDILYSISNQIPIALEPYLCIFEKFTCYDSFKIDKIISTIGKSLKGKSEYCTNLLIQRIKTAQQSKCIKINRLSSCLSNKNKRLSSHINTNGTIIGSTETLEEEIYMNRSHKSNSFRKSNSYSYGRNSEIDPDVKYGSANNENKRCLQILGEIYVIASVHPQILETSIHHIIELFQNPSENVKMIIERLKELQSSSSLCSSFQYEESSNPLDNETIASRSDFKKSFEHSLDSIEIEFKNSMINTHTSPKNETEFSSIFNNPLHIVEHIDNNNIITSSESPENLKSSNFVVSSNRPDHDYEVIKKSDDNLLNDDQTVSEKLEDLSLDCTETQNLLDCDDTSQLIKPDGNKTKAVKSNNTALASIFSSDSNQYSLLNTKIAEESENEDDHERGAQEKIDHINKFGYLKFEKSVNEQKSMSLRESATYDPVASSKIYTSTSFSYQSRPNNSGSTFFCNKDVVQQFCEKHLDKIRSYIKNISQLLPIPVDDIGISNHHELNMNTLRNQKFFMKKVKNKKFCFLNFECECKGEFCLYDRNFFETLTFFPTLWVHLLFLSIQSKLSKAITQQDPVFVGLKNFYESLNEKISFVTLITSSFPTQKQIGDLVEELKETRIFDIFQNKLISSNNIQGEALGESSKIWHCFLCSNPERANDLLNESTLIQGQLKEKHGKYKFLRRWHKRLYSLTNGNIVYYKKDMRQESLSVRYIRNIQTIKSPKSNKQCIPKIFEIFTDSNSYILKAQNSQEAEQWIQYLQLAIAIENYRYNIYNNEHSILLQ